MGTEDDKGPSFAELFEQSDGARSKGSRRPRVGDIVSGRVVALSQESVFVELGAKAEGIIDRAELSDDDGELSVSIGDTVQARVADAREGHILLRTRAARGQDASAELAHAKEHGLAVEGTVSAVIKGGVEVMIGAVRAFCPISQLDSHYVEDPGAFVGRKLEFRVTQYEKGRGGAPNVVISRRALLEAQAAEQAAETRAKLEVGAVVPGTVTALKDYGAFVDLGGLEGMLHISELGFERVGHPSEVLSVGQKVEVQVKSIEPATDPRRSERIGLSLKALQQDPWESYTAQLREGQRLSGEVVRVENFGAFVALSGGIEGLVHVSELTAERRVRHAREVVSVGQQVDVCVLGVDPERRRISLSMKAVAALEEADQAASYQPATGASLGTFADLMKQKLGK